MVARSQNPGAALQWELAALTAAAVGSGIWLLFSLTYARRPDPLRTFVKKIKYRFGLRTRGPHLVAIAKVPST